MNLLSIEDLTAMAIAKDETELALHFEGQDASDTTFGTAQTVLDELQDQARVRSSGTLSSDYDTYDEAFDAVAKAAYVCLKSDYDAEQAQIAEEMDND